MDLVVADEDPTVTALVSALMRWHAAVCAHPRSVGFHGRLQTCLEQLRHAMEPFVAVGVNLNTPKIHRAKDIADIVRIFGGARIVSTDTYEMAHKALKKVFLRYVYILQCSSRICTELMSWFSFLVCF